ncbi:MAG: ceramidase domain-containing protein [Bacteroidetes bacterium]|nr:ceramidase domain-containing protein [Bacteroidota bacterium]
MTVKPIVRYGILGAVILSAIVVVLLHAPVPQDPVFHNFADQRAVCGIPNFWNVASNLLFLAVGLAGIIYTLMKWRSAGYDSVFSRSSLVFFLGIFLTAIGSAYYHHAPSNQRLVWDRLPMTIAFMAFTSVVIGRYMSRHLGHYVLWPFIFMGLASVMYWYMTESRGVGDLRFYMLIQFLPMILIPLILLMFQGNDRNRIYFWIIAGIYLLAKISEAFDWEIYRHLSGFSGHTIKHILSALAPFVFLLWMMRENRERNASHEASGQRN